ncbi:MAG: DNRLRE domain-containing protein [Thermodesulfobacteriota bacterium]|nr:DNRLRE domain-containing protein [Thermodesulfobacteriota bacterium]
MERKKSFPVFLLFLILCTLPMAITHAAYHNVGINDCTGCHYDGQDVTDCIGSANLMLIKDTIHTPSSGDRATVFEPYVAGEPDYNGVCEVCHENTRFHRNNALGDHDHYAEENCMPCHKHSDEFIHGGGQPCESCHGHEGGDGTAFSHATHTAGTVTRGPATAMACSDCHSDPIEMDPTPTFDDDKTLTSTEVCDNCHGEGGAFDGVATAKAGWAEGVYESDGLTLKSGNERWCAGCHDDAGANSKRDESGITAPNIMGDSAQEVYGYYVSGHGRFPANLNCDVCHDLTKPHVDHNHRTYEADESQYVGSCHPPFPGKEYDVGYRLGEGLDIPGGNNGPDDNGHMRLCLNCHMAILGTATNFVYEKGYRLYLHDEHFNFGCPQFPWDSDADGTEDARMTCPTCHNVHGAPMTFDYEEEATLYPNPVMIRHGELTDNVPLLSFRWYTATAGRGGGGDPTSDRDASRSGDVWCQGPSCAWSPCHNYVPYYNRTPVDLIKGILVDDFESYRDDATLQMNWARGEDAKVPFYEETAGPDGSKCMRVRVVWDRTAEVYGQVKRLYDPYVYLEHATSLTFQMKAGNPSKIEKIVVSLRKYPEGTDCEAELSMDGFENGVWKEVTLFRSNFDDTTWGKVSQVRFYIYEVEPDPGQSVDVYFDDILFTLPTISGSVGALDGVTMAGLPGDPLVTTGGGFYTATVGHGWSGTVTPKKVGYTFAPEYREYSNVTSDPVNQDYTPIETDHTISGSVGALDGVTMTGLPGDPVVTTGGGFYAATVGHGWSGTVIPTLEGYVFEPQTREYSNVVSDQTNQDFTPSIGDTVRFGDNTGDDYPGTVEDALIYQNSPEYDYNYGSKTTNPVGERGTLGKERRSLIRFKDIATSLGAGKVIISARMYLYCSGEDSTFDYSVSAYRVLRDWVEGAANGAVETGSVCWNYREHPSASWNSVGCSATSDVTGEDSTADRRATGEDSPPITKTGQHFSWDITTAVQNWYSGAWSEYGLILVNDGADKTQCRKVFSSSENTIDGNRPYLEVTYKEVP